MKRCRRCHRVLKDAESIIIGYGPICYKKIGGISPSNGGRAKKSPPAKSEGISRRANENTEVGPLFIADGLEELERMLEESEDNKECTQLHMRRTHSRNCTPSKHSSSRRSLKRWSPNMQTAT